MEKRIFEFVNLNMSAKHEELQQILAYYRNRVDAFESDRASFYSKID